MVARHGEHKQKERYGETSHLSMAFIFTHISYLPCHMVYNYSSATTFI